MGVEVIGEPDAEFAEELKHSQAAIRKGSDKPGARLVFWFVL